VVVLVLVWARFLDRRNRRS